MANYEVQEHVPQRFESSRRRFLRNLGLAAASVPFLGALAEGLSEMPADATTRDVRAAGRRISGAAASQGGDPFARHPLYKFTVVNHVTTNPFFVPTRYGAQDACTLLGCSYDWVGSATSVVSEMVTAFDAAISARVNGIATSVIDNAAFVAPTNTALAAGIPVIAYNASATGSAIAKNHQMAYVGQDLFQSGVENGNRILPYVKKGDLVAGFIETPGSLNIQPRWDGVSSVLKPAGIDFVEIGTGPTLTQNLATIESWYLGHRDVKFMFSCDGETPEAGLVIEKYGLKGKVPLAGYDFLPLTVPQIQAGVVLWTTDQQPYLQGFLPILQLFLYNISGSAIDPVDTDTGLKFVNKANVGPYLAKDPYEGSSPRPVTLTPPARISV